MELADDDELARLTDCAGGFLTEEEMVVFDNQLSDDEAFFERIAPMDPSSRTVVTPLQHAYPVVF